MRDIFLWNLLVGGSTRFRHQNRTLHPAFMLDREKQFLGGQFHVGVFAGRRSFYQGIPGFEPVPASEIGERQVLGKTMVGVDQRLHTAHGTASWSNPVRKLLGPMHHHIPPLRKYVIPSTITRPDKLPAHLRRRVIAQTVVSFPATATVAPTRISEDGKRSWS